MPQSGLQRIAETGTFSWPWQTGRGLAILTGGSGGGGGGGGAFCIEGLNLYGAGGGGGGDGGQATTVTVGGRVFRASGGDGGSGGGGGGIVDGKPLKGNDGRGSRIEGGGARGQGGTPQESAGRIVSAGGCGGLGFLGQTIVVELTDLSFGDAFQITVGQGGRGGRVGAGFETGRDGLAGPNGSVCLVPIFEGGDD